MKFNAESKDVKVAQDKAASRVMVKAVSLSSGGPEDEVCLGCLGISSWHMKVRSSPPPAQKL